MLGVYSFTASGNVDISGDHSDTHVATLTVRCLTVHVYTFSAASTLSAGRLSMVSKSCSRHSSMAVNMLRELCIGMCSCALLCVRCVCL